MIVISLESQEQADMIFADPSEDRGIGDLAKNSTIVYAPMLEELTGADMMITLENYPCAPAFIPMHIESGAILVQRKKGMDLASSVGERMATSLAKMRATGAKQSQCCLLFIGQMLCDKENCAVIDGQKADLAGKESYWSIMGSMAKWGERGGVVEQLTRQNLLPRWLQMKENHLREFKTTPTHTVYQSPPTMMEARPNDPLQELRLVKDWRTTLLSFPGLGPKRLEDFIAFMDKEKVDSSLWQALVWLTDYDLATQIPGIGKGIVTRCRQWMGLPEGADIGLQYVDEGDQEKEEKA